MSMVLVLTSISDRNIARVFANPPLIWRLLAPDDMEAYQREAKKHNSRGFFSWLFGKPDAQRTLNIPNLDLEEGEGNYQDLDKSWHGIHYLLTKTAWEGDPPLNFLLNGGQEVTNIEVGYGPARIFTSDAVHKINDAISHVNLGDLKSRFDPKDMVAKEIYPEIIWDRDPSVDDTLRYCLEYFEELKRFIADCSRKNFGFVINIE